MKLFFGTKLFNCGHFFTLLMFIITSLFLNACATATHFPLDMAKGVKFSPAEAVAFIRKEARASGTDADYGSFVLDTKGFSFTKTVKKIKKQKKNGLTANVEYQEAQVHHVSWHSVNRIDPYLKETFIGDLYGVQLQFISSKVVSNLRQRISTNLDLYCDNLDELTRVVAALQTLTDH